MGTGIEAKAWGTFAFLFGVGFAVLLRRARARSAPFARFPFRSLDWQLRYGFGLLNEQWLCLTWIGAVILLLEYRPVWRQRSGGWEAPDAWR